MDIQAMMQDPKFAQIVQELMKKKKQQGLEGMLQGGGSMANLGKQLPKLQQIQEQWKLQDAQRKAKKMELDMITKQAEAQSQAQQQQQQMQAAQQSV